MAPMEMNRRSFLKAATALGAVLVARLPLADSEQPSLTDMFNERVATDAGEQLLPLLERTEETILSVIPVCPAPSSQALLDLREWFDECATLIFATCRRLKVPMNRREIQVYLPPRVADVPGMMRFTGDWYDGDRRYGFKVAWAEFRPWPEPDEILKAVEPLLQEYARVEILPHARYIFEDDEGYIWI